MGETSSYGTRREEEEEELLEVAAPVDDDGVEEVSGLAFGRRGRRMRWIVVATSMFAMVAVVGTRRVAAPSETVEAEIVATLSVSSEYEEKSGRRTGDGLYPFEHLVEVHRETRCAVTTSIEATCEWAFDDGETAEGCETTHVWRSVGERVVVVRLTTNGQRRERSFAVNVRYVRHELRDLTDDDRERYFGAVSVVYRTSQEDGEKLYGDGFWSASRLVREHLYGAASKECDHWHDDAGFLNHHVGITWQFEQSIQAIDSTTCAHYWDYTLDAETRSASQFSESTIFAEDWFGPSSPANAEHVVDQGRFAFVAVLSAAQNFSSITNPYGLLRSPWNTNPTPFLTRFDQVLGMFHDAYTLTTCRDFSDALAQYDSIAQFISKLNGKLHGPIHIMIGGHWWFDRDDGQNNSAAAWLGSSVGARSRALLASKFLWRQGYARCPVACSSDADWRDCACACPTQFAGITDDDAYKLLSESGLLDINKSWQDAGDWRQVLSFLCHLGHPGEMFTSAAPQDPTFWPLHGNAERFVHLVRLLNDRGEKPLDETWGYAHVTTGLDSDTHVVCDWDNVTGMGLPACRLGETCSGHREDDLLPFMLYQDQPGYFTNGEFYNYTSPLNSDVPYVYDRLLYWPACADQTIWYPDGPDPGDSPSSSYDARRPVV